MHPCRRISRTGLRGSIIREIAIAALPFVLLLLLLTPLILLFTAKSCRKGDLRPLKARSLIITLEAAIECYRENQGTYPPDWIPAGARLHGSIARDLEADKAQSSFCPDPPVECGAEALFYYLCSDAIIPLHPLLELADDQCTDRNGNGVPAICDPWGRPILYDRPPFPIDQGYDCPDSDGPKHNRDRFDVYVIRPTGMFGRIKIAEPGPDTLRRFNTEALKTYGVGDRDDVIGNW